MSTSCCLVFRSGRGASVLSACGVYRRTRYLLVCDYYTSIARKSLGTKLFAHLWSKHACLSVCFLELLLRGERARLEYKLGGRLKHRLLQSTAPSSLKKDFAEFTERAALLFFRREELRRVFGCLWGTLSRDSCRVDHLVLLFCLGCVLSIDFILFMLVISKPSFTALWASSTVFRPESSVWLHVYILVYGPCAHGQKSRVILGFVYLQTSLYGGTGVRAAFKGSGSYRQSNGVKNVACHVIGWLFLRGSHF